MYDLQSIITFNEAKGKHKLVLDANLLILLFVGLFDPEHIENCNRLIKKSNLTKDDFLLLMKILDNFEPEIIITPHVLTEISNMSRATNMGLENRKNNYFTLMINKLKNFREQHITLSELLGIDLNHVIEFGFSDLGIIETAKKLDAVILSNDFDMTEYARSQTPLVIYFTHIKTSTASLF